ncbi:hypothetical protein IKT18_00845 [Candidatus Saccharibacteria bacterium]|nr:hypothetical protein [Candidatus Saccharibacteria bacterium]
MKYKKAKAALAAAILTAANVIATPVFAANPYGIEYDGGTLLGEGVVKLLDKHIAPLIDPSEEITIEFSNSDLWNDGYSFDVPKHCQKAKYLKILESTTADDLEGVYYTISNGKFKIKVEIASILNQVEFNNAENDNEWIAIHVSPKGDLTVGYKISKDSECSTKEDGVILFLNSYGVRGTFFVETKQTLMRIDGEQEKLFKNDDLYYGIMDIDAAQSYKILNSSNQLIGGENGNMFAKSFEALQPTEEDDDADEEEGSDDAGDAVGGANMYVGGEGKYIYSTTPPFTIDGGSNVYVKLNETTQNEGVKMVYGFASAAGSSAAYHAKQYTVEYVSDKNGEIEDIETENILPGETPSGSTTAPADGYELDYWTADKDVTLTDGTTIKAGNPISSEELAEVIVNEDLVFTAVHVESEPLEVPDTGASTSEKNAALVAISVIGAVLGASILGILAKAIRKIHRRSQF